MHKVIVIYYDGNQTLAKRMETENPDSSVAWVFGLYKDYLISAVIEDKGNYVFIDEELVLGESPL